MDIRNHALLVGFGRVGSLLGENYWRRGFRWWLSNVPYLRGLSPTWIRAVLGNAANEEIMNLAHSTALAGYY